jgi:hypothetical protein
MAQEDQTSQADQAVDADTPSQMLFRTFLETIPPTKQIRASAVVARKSYSNGTYRLQLETPELNLYCTSDDCSGTRFFRYRDGDIVIEKENASSDHFLNYVCANCGTRRKTFSLRVKNRGARDASAFVLKFGEVPIFGPETPPRLLKLLEDQRDIFLKGRRCENQGLGIGAFGYYRRVVEHQKNKILDEIIEVSTKLGAPKEMVDSLIAAKKETQFLKSVASVKDAIPQSLLINGHHNPLNLLHSALSSGLHEQTDDRCLELAQAVRVVLAELAERIGQALKDKAELNDAVSLLLKAREPAKQEPAISTPADPEAK